MKILRGLNPRQLNDYGQFPIPKSSQMWMASLRFSTVLQRQAKYSSSTRAEDYGLTEESLRHVVTKVRAKVPIA
ncbi:hypothetical protein SH467x_003932 [Pirellulaceae bacterium SH467]